MVKDKRQESSLFFVGKHKKKYVATFIVSLEYVEKFFATLDCFGWNNSVEKPKSIIGKEMNML